MTTKKVMQPSEFEHSPQRGYVQISQVLDPFTYWIRCQDCLHIDYINKKLSHIVNRQILNYPNCGFTPDHQEIVIVQDIDGKYYRACISSASRDGHYTVILLDKCGTLTVGEENIYYLPEPWSSIKEQGHLIHLHGVVPSPDIDWDKPINWREPIENWLFNADEIQLEDFCYIANSLFGSIIFFIDSNLHGLDEIVFQQKYGVPSLHFEKDITESWNCYQKKLESEQKAEAACKGDDIAKTPPEKITNSFKIAPQAFFLLRLLTGQILLPQYLCFLALQKNNKRTIENTHLNKNKKQKIINMDKDINIAQSPIDSSSVDFSESKESITTTSEIVNSSEAIDNSPVKFKKKHRRHQSIGSKVANEEVSTKISNGNTKNVKTNNEFDNQNESKFTDLNLVIRPSSSDSTRTVFSETCKSDRKERPSTNIKSNDAPTINHKSMDEKQLKKHQRRKSISSSAEITGFQDNDYDDVKNVKSSNRRSLGSHQTPKYTHTTHKSHRFNRSENLYSPDSSNSSRSFDQSEGFRGNSKYNRNSNDCSQNSRDGIQKPNISMKTKRDRSCDKDKNVRHFHNQPSRDRRDAMPQHQRIYEAYNHSREMFDESDERSNERPFSRAKSRDRGEGGYSSPKMHESREITRNNLRSSRRGRSKNRADDYYDSRNKVNRNTTYEEDLIHQGQYEVYNHTQRMYEPSGTTGSNMRSRSKSRNRTDDHYHPQEMERAHEHYSHTPRMHEPSGTTRSTVRSRSKSRHCTDDQYRSQAIERAREHYSHTPKMHEPSGTMRSTMRSRSKSRSRTDDQYHSQVIERAHEHYSNSPRMHEPSGQQRNNNKTLSRSKSRDRIDDHYHSQIVEERNFVPKQNKQYKHFETSDYKNDHKDELRRRSKSISRIQNSSNTNSPVSHRPCDDSLSRTERNKSAVYQNSPTSEYDRFSIVNDSRISTPKEEMCANHSREFKANSNHDQTSFGSKKDIVEESGSQRWHTNSSNDSLKGKFEAASSPSQENMKINNTSTSGPNKVKGVGRGQFIKSLTAPKNDLLSNNSRISSKSSSTSESMESIHIARTEETSSKEIEKSANKESTSAVSKTPENLDSQTVSELTITTSDKITNEPVNDSQVSLLPNRKYLINNEHEDRYFDIEPPKFLNYPLDEATLVSNEEKKKGALSSPSSGVAYEQLLSDTTEHEPIDSSALQSNTIKLEQEILNEYSVGQLAEKMKLTCGIIHGNIKSQPISKVHELNLHKHVIANMNHKKIHDLTRSQMYAIPVLLQRRNLILVGPPNTGKTFAYIIAIMSLLEDTQYYEGIKQGNGPRCIFLTASSQCANHISQFCSAISGARYSIITTYGGGLETQRQIELANGCEVLVTTPRCLLRLLKHTAITNISRLCHLVFDDFDFLMEKFLPEVQDIMLQTKKMLHLRKGPIGLHIVVVGEKWSPLLDESLKAIDSPVLCITSHLEAAMYAKLKPTTYILQPGAKIQKLRDLLQRNTPRKRTVIVCKNASEVKMLRPILELSLPDVLVVHEEMSLTLVCGTSTKWVKSVSPPILVCSDSILGELAITNAQHLIHYSLPENKSYFTERFGSIIEHFHDRLKHPKSGPPDCQVDILVDETNEQQFPEIVAFMKRLSTPIPQEILTAVVNISNERESKKMDAPLCTNILMFGHCYKKDRCNYRHIFSDKKDICKNLPRSGILKLKCLSVHNASRYSVRIIATKQNTNDKWEKFKSNYVVIGFKMASYFSQRENRLPHGRVNIGDMVALEVEPDILFKRAVVTEIIERDEKLNPIHVKLRLIDDGLIKRTKTILLLHLPPELQNFEPESYDLYLTGLQPVDYDPDWSYASYLSLNKKIHSLANNENENFFVAKILLSVGENIITNSFVCYEWLELNKVFRVIFSPKKLVFDSQFAVPNEGHVPSLLKLAFDGGLISSTVTELKEEDQESRAAEKVHWAHLEENKFIPCVVISCEHPSLFYLKLDYFSPSLSFLQKDLKDALEKRIIKPEMLREDMVCAVKNPLDNEWNRAIILEVLSEEVEVFCVDYGDVIKVPLADISLLPEGFISRLPFQAIECSLVGIVPLSKDKVWADDALNYFYLLTANEDNVLKLLYAKVCEVQNEAKTTDGHHYKVILIDVKDDDLEVCLNKDMVYKGYANWDFNSKSCLSDIGKVAEVVKAHSKCEEQLEENAEQEFWSEEMSTVPPDETSKVSSRVSKTVEEKTEKNSPTASFKVEDLLNGDFDFVFDSKGFEEFKNLWGKSKGDSNNLPALPPIESLPDTIDKESVISVNISNNSITGRESRSELESTSKVSFSECIESSDDESTFTETNYTNLTKVFDNVFFPKTLWSQTACNIKLKVMVPDIIEYQLDYSEFELHFTAYVDEKYYWFDIELFGPVCAESTVYSPKGQYFEIKLEKFIKGVPWPRVTYKDMKYSWLKVDPESISKEKRLSISDQLIDRGSKIAKYKDAYSKYLSEGSSPYGICGPDVDSDSESVNSNSSEKEFFDLRSPFDVDV